MKRMAAAAAALSIVASVFVGSGAAFAAGITSADAWNTYGENPGTIHVSVEGEADVASIHVDFRNSQTDEIAGSADNFVFEEAESDGSRRYVTSSPVILDPADYYADIDVTDTTGAHLRTESGGPIEYRIHAVVDVTADHTSIGYDDRVVTFSGVLKGTWPGTGEVRPLGDMPITVLGPYPGSDEPFRTEADGTFSHTVTVAAVGTPSLEFDASLQSEPGDTQFYEGDITILTLGKTAEPTRITAALDKTEAATGDPVTISGKVERLSPDGWVPAVPDYTDVMVDLYGDDGSGFSFGPEDVADDSTFTIHTVARVSGSYQISVSDTGWFGYSSTTLPIAVAG